MTVSSVEPVNNYKGNGSTVNFDFDFYVEDASQLEVYLTDNAGVQTKLTYNTDYTIHELKNKNGSYIIYPIAGSSHGVLASDETISLVLALPIVQDKEYENSGALHLDTLEYSLDYLTLLIQILSRKISRALKIQEGSDIDMDTLSSSLVTAANNADNINTAAENIQNINAVGNSISALNAVSADLENVDFLADNIDYVHNVQIWTEGTDAEVQAIGGEHSAKGWAEQSTNANVSLSNLNAAGEARLRNTSYPIGAPIPSLSNDLSDNEIWLEGAEVSKTAYAALYAVYGDTYNLAPAPAAGNFKLPDLRNRALWGSSSFGYISGILPRLEGSIALVTGAGSSSPAVTGAFSVSDFVYNNGYGAAAGGGNNSFTLKFDAYAHNPIYGSSVDYVRPTAVKVRFKTRYK